MLNKNDFIEVEYTGELKEDNSVFDTTHEETAKKSGIHNPKIKYGPVVLCIGQKQILPGIDKQLEGKEVGKEYKFEISADEGFGKKDPALIQLIATSKFKKANLMPMPGMQVTIDNQVGTVKAVSGGRTIVDFNHPLSGKDLSYKIKILKKIDETNRKVSVLIGALLQIEEPEVAIAEDKAMVTLAFDIPEEVQKVIKNKVLEIVKLSDITFAKKAEKPAAEKKQESK